MAELADAFVALPGGIGTIEEFMEVWTQNQLGEIDKPAGLLDTAGFYQPFLGFINSMIAARFLPEAHRHSIAVDADPATSSRSCGHSNASTRRSGCETRREAGVRAAWA